MCNVGFSHMWYTQKIIEKKKFNLIINDISKLLPIFKKLNIPIMGPNGIGDPIINEEQIALNGKTHCGHDEQNIFNAWPTNDAKGINNLKNRDANNSSWFSTILNTRTCDGSCSFEPLIINRICPRLPYSSTEDLSLDHLQCFSSCKTGFRPYDIVVMSVLIIAKHHLENLICIKSDGIFDHWQDIIILLEHFLCYDHNIFYMIKNDLS